MDKGKNTIGAILKLIPKFLTEWLECDLFTAIIEFVGSLFFLGSIIIWLLIIMAIF